jgi:hypothetical protein
MKVNDVVDCVEAPRRAPDVKPEAHHHGRQTAAEGPERGDELARKASRLAASHQVSGAPTRGQLLVPRVTENVRELLAAHQQFVAATTDRYRLSPAARCLMNNFEPVGKQLSEIAARIQPGYDDKLPKLADGDLAGYPRVYAIALSLIADTDGRLDAGVFKEYFRAYQRTSPLSTAELMSSRAMLRLALIEHLRRAVTPGAVANGIESLRRLSGFDADDFFESVSPVESALRAEPSGVYASMEAATRRNYRRAVTETARRTGVTESVVALRAVGMAAQAFSARPHDGRRAHVGYYLVDDGLHCLEASLGYAPRRRERLTRVIRRHLGPLYVGLVAALTVLAAAPFILYAARLGVSAPVLACLAALLLAPVSDVVLAVIHRLAPSRPTLLPKMDFSRGLPEEAQTLVVVPAILSSEVVVRELLETIEAHYLSNRDDRLFFALLSDWRDAEQESMPDDEALLRAARDGVKKLNERHGDGTRDRFYLFHRRRRWNPSQGKWLGWERKRGKLHEFNRLLRGASDTSYVGVTADGDFLARTRYVITLDADTLLPRDAARRLVGTISHPLNRPQCDEQTGRVVRGYGIIQPHVAMPPPGAQRSSVPGLLVNRFNLNTYSVASSNLYQDLFGESSYVGKGLYDVDIFEAALKGRAPENALLSHDMFEGLYARPALAADIRIFDSPQSHYESVARRQHRWTRGDWQLWPWLLPLVPAAHGAATRNVLPAIARWKILDNMRRSLVQPALLLWLVAAWTVLPGSPAVWTLLALLTLLAKLSFPLTHDLLSTLRHDGPSKSVRAVGKLVTKKGAALLLQLAGALAYLAHQSYLTLDAIARTIYRTTVSRKRLLEWVTAAQAQSDSSVSLSSSVRYMWQAPAMAAACGLLVLLLRPGALPLAAPFLLAWVASPVAVHLLNRRIQNRSLDLERVVERALRLSGHRMWQTLETFFGVRYDSRADARNQTGYIDPLRSSPVNLARLLLWTKAAYELGSIGATELAGRLELTLSEVDRLRLPAGSRRSPRVSPTPGALPPAFILQAENGNLAGHLGTLGQFCAEVAARPPLGERVLKGLADTVLLMMDGLTRIVVSVPEGGGDALEHLREELEMCARYLSGLQREGTPQTFTEWRRVFDTLAQRAAIVQVELDTLSHSGSATKVAEVGHWAVSLARQVSGLRADLRMFAPWVSLPTRHLASLIRRHDAWACAHWRRIIEVLERPSAVSLLPATLGAALAELALLSERLDDLLPSETPDRKSVLDGCEQLRGAIEEAARSSAELTSRYARLAERGSAFAVESDFASLFDEERRMLKRRFPDKVA